MNQKLKKQIKESQQPSRDRVSSVQSENIIFYGVVRGVNNKGRIFCLGSEAEKYKPSYSRLSNGISNSEYEQMKNLILNWSKENKTLKEKITKPLRVD
ncbi:hypothetical protein Fmac_032705 [Flemingia macrophylla]|uniref:Uncharacterized protein n=1 Tax=Flemingia macrophylla TaxID=520843 RepID=A0ABD1L5Q3_9FABA